MRPDLPGREIAPTSGPGPGSRQAGGTTGQAVPPTITTAPVIRETALGQSTPDDRAYFRKKKEQVERHPGADGARLLDQRPGCAQSP